jgi:hypothetical protein
MKNAELIFSKVLTYAKALIEYQNKAPHLPLLRTKYASVATYFYILSRGVPQDDSVNDAAFNKIK